MKMQGEFLRNLNVIKKRYEMGENLIQLLSAYTTGGNGRNALDAIAVSYDLQAGTYIRFAEENIGYKEAQTRCLAKILGQLGGFTSIVEAGVGECTTLSYLLKNLNTNIDWVFGFDISWSRLRYGRMFCDRFAQKRVNLFSGNLFQIPLLDNSVDVVYTFHSIEPNGGKEKEALAELYRVAKKYVVLCEPAYDFAGESAKQRMKKHGFACDIYPAVMDLGYDVVEHRVFDVCYNNLNPTGLTIIKKKSDHSESLKCAPYACPITRTPLKLYDNCYFSPTSLLAYPVISNIPCLLTDNAIVATHFGDFEKNEDKNEVL